MAEFLLPKQIMRVRFPLPAPNKNGRPHGRPFLFGVRNKAEHPPEVCGCR